jgi:CheY-like chemotaxis protein
LLARSILVADEDNDTRIILRTVLERDRFAVVEAATADDAFDASQVQAFDLIILNYPMATPDGRTLVQRLRAVGATQHVPILNLTSRVVPQFLREAAEDGVTLTLPKPIDIENVINVVSELLSARSAALIG